MAPERRSFLLLGQSPSLRLRTFILMLFGAYTGCAFAPQPPKGSPAFATWSCEDSHVSVAFVDGKKTSGFWRLFMTDSWARNGELTPGMHTLEPFYQGAFRSRYTFKLNAEAGHYYILKSKIYTTGKREAARIWIDDLSNSKTVGELLISENEPVVPEVPRLEQSALYKWSPPQADHWLIFYRNDQQTILGKDGDYVDETFVVEITPLVLPTFASETDFIAMYKKGIAEEPNDGRFLNLEDTFEPIHGPGDMCIYLHHVAEDHAAKKQSLLNKEPMILENHVYACRLPGNKNLGISFTCSHRYYRGHQSPSFQNLARGYFAKLEL
jgi:hypothetical protein